MDKGHHRQELRRNRREIALCNNTIGALTNFACTLQQKQQVLIDNPRIDISENFCQDPRVSVSTWVQLHPSTHPLKAVSVIKNHIHYLLLPHPCRATNRAAASATTARQPWEDLWIKYTPAGNLTVVSNMLSDCRSSHASSIINLSKIEISDSNSCTCVTSIAFKRKTYRDNTSLSVDSKPRIIIILE
ncbi:uncharacterized protein BO88DRAFT_427264 [Aspergillus vadensis CBS 113365]|uniref:Uncharacterized protein n=1 Tax=Aspergillus vadensis (strain CBS 113365 / IMI 142717 / IBT 24658) TaxID=1448311 RepID=A0A319B2X3_ASPVC|nr:hypothetical protein BO88DRAFT_427264 [Aspergillus vadensis CBS 113365]PYH67096.1 hypothetical protein BO88DRAFT_427264 [Aspergillus vadensis CBS 113365]